MVARGWVRTYPSHPKHYITSKGMWKITIMAVPPEETENEQGTCIKSVESELEGVGMEMCILTVVFVIWATHP